MAQLCRILFPLLLLVAAACGPKLAEVRRAVQTSPQRTVTVFPFTSSQDNPDAGRLAAEIMEHELRRLGFEVVPSTPPPSVEPADLAAAASRAGANSFVFGRVDQLSESPVTHPEQYEERARTFVDATGKEQLFTDRVLLQPGRIEYVPVFRGSALLLDVGTAAVLWEGSTWTETRAADETAAAETGIEALAWGLAKKLSRESKGATR